MNAANGTLMVFVFVLASATLPTAHAQDSATTGHCTYALAKHRKADTHVAQVFSDLPQASQSGHVTCAMHVGAVVASCVAACQNDTSCMSACRGSFKDRLSRSCQTP